MEAEGQEGSSAHPAKGERRANTHIPLCLMNGPDSQPCGRCETNRAKGTLANKSTTKTRENTKERQRNIPIKKKKTFNAKKGS